jgi:CubicO group peptidase (beta-lactamase class C family)
MPRHLACLLIALVAVATSSCSLAQDATNGEAAVPDRLEMAAQYSAATSGDALLVWQEGTLVLERAQNGYDLQAPHILASGSKTFSGLMAWAAVTDGVLTLDEGVAETLTAWQDDPQKADVTVRQLLHLTSGLETSVGRAPSFDDAVQKPLVHAPGEGFRYGPTAFQVFGALLEQKLDGEDPAAYLQRRILDPLGAEVTWTRVDGNPQLAGGARMTAGDWLRVGRLILNDGVWNGERVLPAGLRDALATPTEASPGYGLTVWLNAAVPADHPFRDHAPAAMASGDPDGLIYADGPPDLFMAAGLFNQRLYVIPSRETVVVRFGRADRSFRDAELLARLLDGRELDLPDAPKLPKDERVALLTDLRLAQLDRELRLTDAQEDAIRPAVQQQMEALAALDGASSMSRRERRRLFRRLRTVQRETNRAIEAELTDAQVEQYRAFLAEQRAERRARQRR